MGSGNFGTVREASPQLTSKLLEQMMTTDQKEKADTEQEHQGTDSFTDQESTVRAIHVVKKLSRTTSQ